MLELPEPPYVAVIFSSVRTAGDHGYDATAARMDELAAAQPGYLGIESARNPDGFGITISYWATAEDAAAWKGVVEHRDAQRRGREQWYESYAVRICVVQRAYAGPGGRSPG
jgi:heme-degrading monooxygenase HmoA